MMLFVMAHGYEETDVVWKDNAHGQKLGNKGFIMLKDGN